MTPAGRRRGDRRLRAVAGATYPLVAPACKHGGNLVLRPGQRVPAQRRVDELVDRVPALGDLQPQVQVGVGPAQRRAPVREQVVVAHERPRAAPGLPLGVQQRVHPAGQVLGRESRLAHPLVAREVVRGPAAEHLGRVPQHHLERQPQADPLRRPPPQVQRPGRARVLHQRRGLPGGHLGQPLHQPGLRRFVGGTTYQLQRLGTAVGDVHVRPLQQLVVELNRPP